MAVLNNSLGYFGGMQSGGEVYGDLEVLERSDMTSPFTDAEYNKCVGAINNGKGLCTQWRSGTSTMQARFCAMLSDGSLIFVFAPVNAITNFVVNGTQPHTIQSFSVNTDNYVRPLTAVGQKIAEGRVNGQNFDLFAPEPCSQFVLRRANMSEPFTSEEFDTCQDEQSIGHSVVVQFASGGLAEAQLIQTKTDGALVFSRARESDILTYTVAPGGVHYITTEVETIPNPDSVLTMRIGGLDKTYTPTGPNLSIDIDSEVSRVYLAKGSADVATLNATIPGLTEGWSYVLTDSGTLTAGNVSVDIGDNVAWNGSEWFKIGNQVAVNALFIKSDAQYVFALVDSNDVLLFAIKTDGSVTWAKGLPDFLQRVLDGKVDVISGKTLIESTYANCAGSTSDSEFAWAVVDANEKMLFGVRHDGTVTSGVKIDGLQQSVAGKTVIDIPFANSTKHASDFEFDYVITDNSGKVLFGIRRDGSFESAGLMSMITGDSGELASKSYVQGAVFGEETRAKEAEQALAESIANINPTVVVGGENTPDDVFLATDGNDAITFKNISSSTYGYGTVYLKSTDDAKSILESVTKTIVKIYFPINLNGETITLQSDVVLDFCGGSMYNGTVVGNNTSVKLCKKCLGATLSISGTWNVQYIMSSALADSTSPNALRTLCSLLSDVSYNVLHVEAGNYTFTPTKNADKLIALKSNTKLVIDGNIAITPNGYPNYYIVRADNVNNIEISGNGSIVGDADIHDYITIPSTHEWGMCIALAGVHGAYVHDIELKGATGDGIDISETGSRVSKRITVERCVITHCGRQGISITAGEQFKVRSCRIDDIYRTLPKAAVDIEANVGYRVECVEVSDILISNCCGVMALHSDNVSFSDITANECARIFYAEDVNFVSLERCHSTSSKTSSDYVEATNDCSNVRFDNVCFDGTGSQQVDINNILFNYRCDFGNTVVTGSPTAGSNKYDNGKFIQFDGINWVNFDGTQL